MKPKSINIDGEGHYLKKDKFGWRVVHPIFNEDKSWNYKNLFIGGSYWNILKIGARVGLLIFLIVAYKHDLATCEELIRCGAKCPPINTNPFISWG
jgi:hypothetical protein